MGEADDEEEMTTVADLAMGMVVILAVTFGSMLAFGQCKPAPSAPGCGDPVCEAALP
jgi:hypothetical protein